MRLFVNLFLCSHSQTVWLKKKNSLDRKLKLITPRFLSQCLRISAKDVVEDMKLFMSGKGVPGRGGAARAKRGEHIPPPPQEPAPEPPLGMNGYRGDFCKYTVMALKSFVL